MTAARRSRWRSLRLTAAPAVAVSTVLVLAGCTAGAPTPAGTSGRQTVARPSSSTVGSSPAPLPTARRPVVVRARLLPWRLPEPLAREAVAAGPRGVVVAGGMLRDGSSTGTAYELDLRGGRVRTLPDLPVAVHDVAGVRAAAGFEVMGGGNTSEQSVVQVLDGQRRWTMAHALPTARSDLAAVSAGGRVHVIGGYDGSSPALAEVLESTQDGAWRVAGRLPVPVRYPAVAVSGGGIWVIGGERAGAMVTTIQRIDLATGRVRIVARLSAPLGHAVAVTLGGRVLIVGGRTSPDHVTSAMWWFDPSSRSLRRAGRLATPLADSAVVVANGSAYLLGGETPEVSNHVLRLTLGQ